MKLACLIKVAIGKLVAAGVPSASLDARILAKTALGLSNNVILDTQVTVLPDEICRYQSLIDRRARREPVARILGAREFWSLNFYLDVATLDPRPESETVIEAVCKLIDRTLQFTLVDLGTGTGCLLLSVLNEFSKVVGIGIDLCPEAVIRARFNAEQLGLAERASFVVGSWGAALVDECCDLVVSNPPYIPSDEIIRLSPEVQFDPRVALDGGKDGLAAYRLLIPDILRLLRPGGFAACEVGKGQDTAVAEIFMANGMKVIEIIPDLARIPRVVVASRAAA